jgi:hypothetical protein
MIEIDSYQDDARRIAHARKVLDRYGLKLRKSSQRNPDHPEYGRFNIFDVRYGGTVASCTPWLFSMSLEDVEAYLESDF